MAASIWHCPWPAPHKVNTCSRARSLSTQPSTWTGPAAGGGLWAGAHPAGGRPPGGHHPGHCDAHAARAAAGRHHHQGAWCRRQAEGRGSSQKEREPTNGKGTRWCRSCKAVSVWEQDCACRASSTKSIQSLTSPTIRPPRPLHVLLCRLSTSTALAAFCTRWSAASVPGAGAALPRWSTWWPRWGSAWRCRPAHPLRSRCVCACLQCGVWVWSGVRWTDAGGGFGGRMCSGAWTAGWGRGGAWRDCVLHGRWGVGSMHRT